MNRIKGWYQVHRNINISRRQMFPGFRYFQTKQCKSVTPSLWTVKIRPAPQNSWWTNFSWSWRHYHLKYCKYWRCLVKQMAPSFITELHRLHLQIPTPKTTWILSLKHRRKVGLHHWFRRQELNFKSMKWTEDCLRIPLLWLYARLISSHDIILHI